ncbi:MAG: 2Fe-2S ferredoxin [Candidatus Endobugula sp.]|jgi:2Fe-2S ferredoxin
MALIFYTTHDGNTFEADVAVGENLMQAAIDNGIDGIVGACGGSMCCATCHCYVDDAWISKTGVAKGAEREMVEATQEPKPTSRLSCQLLVTEEMDGLTIHLPAIQ